MLLAFEVVLFGGLAFMFFCILRNQDAMVRTMREEHAAILSTLAQVEKRLAVLQQLEANLVLNPQAASPRPQEAAGPEEAVPGTWGRAVSPVEEAPASPLDGLSMDPPSSLRYEEDERPKGALPDLKI